MATIQQAMRRATAGAVEARSGDGVLNTVSKSATGGYVVVLYYPDGRIQPHGKFSTLAECQVYVGVPIDKWVPCGNGRG